MIQRRFKYIIILILLQVNSFVVFSQGPPPPPPPPQPGLPIDGGLALLIIGGAILGTYQIKRKKPSE